MPTNYQKRTKFEHREPKSANHLKMFNGLYRTAHTSFWGYGRETLVTWWW